MRYVEFRAGRFLAWAFLALEPIIGLPRAQRIMVWAITHKPFHRREAAPPPAADPPPVEVPG